MLPVARLTREGLDLHYLHRPAAGNGAIVVFAHGFPGNAFDWNAQFPIFDESFALVAPFMLGTFDGRKAPTARLTAESLCADFAAILQQVDPSGERPLYFIGHDLGCFINTAMMNHYGARSKAIVHINGLGLQQFYTRLFGLSQWRKSFYVLLLQFAAVRYLIAEVLPQRFLKLIYRLCGLAHDDALHLHDKRVFSGIYIYKVLFKLTRRFLGQPIVVSPTPAVFIWGNRDAFLDIPTQKEADQFYQQAEIRIVKGGHWVNRSNAAHVNRILAGLASQWKSPSQQSPNDAAV